MFFWQPPKKRVKSWKGATYIEVWGKYVLTTILETHFGSFRPFLGGCDKYGRPLDSLDIFTARSSTPILWHADINSTLKSPLSASDVCAYAPMWYYVHLCAMSGNTSRSQTPHGSPRSHQVTQVTREFECQAVQLKDKICPKHMVLASQQIMAVP